MKKKLLSLVLVLAMTFTVGASALALSVQEPTYNPVLMEIGISEEAFAAMPREKQMLYQGITQITEAASDTKYFKEVGEMDDNGEMEYRMEEITKAEFDAKDDRPVTRGNPSTSTDTWVTMTTTIKKGDTVSGKVRYYVMNTMKLDRNAMNQGFATNKSVINGITLNSHMSPVSGSELLTITYTHLTGSHAGEQKTEYIMDAQHRSAAGYAFDFVAENSKINYEVTAVYQAMENTSTGVTVVDAYGGGGYLTAVLELTGCITFMPDFGFGIGFGLESYYIEANNTHAQIFV